MQPKELQDSTIAVRDLYAKTLKSSARLDLDSGIEMFLNLVKRNPDLVPARERLRELEQRKVKDMGMFEIVLANLFSAFTVFFKIKPMVEKDPMQAILLCEDVLAECLNNRFALIELANAAAELDARFIGIEAVTLLRHFWKDTQAVSFTANYLVESGRPEEGAKLYQELLDADPNNGRIKSLIREALAVASLKNDSKSVSAAQTRDSKEAIAQQLMDGTIHDAEQAKVLIAKYQEMLAEKESTDIRRRMAEAYWVAEDYDSAIANLEKVAELLGALDPALDKSIEKAYLMRFETQIKQCRNSGAEEQAAALEQQRRDYQLKKAEARVSAYPNDLQLHYDLALLYFEDGRSDEALEQFQSARNHPQRRVICQYYIGRCLALRGMTDMAIEQLTEACKNIPSADRMHKEALYYLALTQEEAGQKDEALARYKELYQEDVSYRDVEERLKRLSA